MGCEFGQESEWSEGRSLDWWLLDQPLHYRVHNLVKDLNGIYRSHRALWELDADRCGLRVARGRRRRPQHVLVAALRLG